MSVTLTSTDLGRINAALRILVSAHRYDQIEDWRADLRRSLAPVLGAAARARSGPNKEAHSGREMAIVRLLRPVYRAGMRTHRDLHRRDVMWGRLIQRIGVGAAAFDAAGGLRHQNPALSRLLLDDPERYRLGREVASVARLALARHRRRTLGASEIVEREVRTTRSKYALSGVYVGPGKTSSSCCITVFVERIPPRAVGAGRLHGGYGLTRRERQVAGLLASGGSTSDVARALGISVHTARRHAEHLLSKLGVHSRGAAVAKLRADY